MPQFSYDYPLATLGQIGTYDTGSIKSLFWPLLAQTTTVTVGGNDDGTYTVQIEGREGLFQGSFEASGNSVAEITDGLAAALTTDALANIVVATSDGVDELALVFITEGYSYDVSFPSNPGDNLSITAQQASGGPNLPLALGVVDDGGQAARLPETGDTASDIVGIVVRNADQVLPFSITQPLTPEFAPGSEISVLLEGTCWVKPEVNVVIGDPLFVRVTAGAGEQAGALRNDSDGGDAVQIRGRFETAAAAGGFARIRVNQP